MFYKMSSSELLRRSPGNLLRNFLRHVLEMKSEGELQQRVYNVVLRRTMEDDYYVLTLRLLNNDEINEYQTLLQYCITESGVPDNNIKLIQARLKELTEKYWQAFYIQTLTGTGMHLYGGDLVSYSPRIHKMLQSSKLTQLR